MSRIDELIARLCPGGVERKTFAEVGRLVRGHGMPKADFVEAGVGAIHYGQIYTYYGTWTTSTRSFVSPETAARLAKVGPPPPRVLGHGGLLRGGWQRSGPCLPPCAGLALVAPKRQSSWSAATTPRLTASIARRAVACSAGCGAETAI